MSTLDSIDASLDVILGPIAAGTVLRINQVWRVEWRIVMTHW